MTDNLTPRSDAAPSDGAVAPDAQTVSVDEQAVVAGEQLSDTAPSQQSTPDTETSTDTETSSEVEVTATDAATDAEAPTADASAAEAPTAEAEVAATEADAPAADAPPAEAEAPAAEAPAADAEAPAAEAPDAEAEAQAEQPAAPEVAPGPKPKPKRGPHPAPRPTPARRQAVADPVVPAAPASDPRPWGRVAEDGSVFVKDPAVEGGERFVGSYPDAPESEALAYYGRKFDELVGLVAFAEQKLATQPDKVADITRELKTLREQLPQAGVVGDLAGLAKHIEDLEGGLAERRAAAERAKAEAKAEAVTARTALVAQAEEISGTDVKRMQWKQATETMNTLFEEWKTAQRQGPRIDKPVEDELWHRFSHARTTFDRARRHHFSQLHSEHSTAKTAKEKLIAEAEALSKSTDWGSTSTAYRQLMDRWKAAGRAGRKDDDALWARFRAAQDVFFNARSADNAKSDAEMTANLEVKEKLLVEAEALVPVKDVKAAKQALRSIQDRWEAAGKVPRADMQRVERRLKAVEQAVRDREDERWKRSNPETKARTEGALGQLNEAIAGLEADLAAAQASGNQKKVAEAQAALTARKSWLEAIERTARDLR